MRLIISGDKSRYHFFRSIIDLSKLQNQESFFTERLGEREVFVTSDIKKTDKNIFFSSKVPLNTELYFPSEYTDLFDVITNEDKVVVFDEFPYASDDKIDKLDNILQSGKVVQVSVVLFWNNRESLETDISTEDIALKDAEEYYGSRNIRVYKYSLKDVPVFLLWSSNNGIIGYENAFVSKMELTKLNLETLDSAYELMFDCWDEHGKSMVSLIEFDILARFCVYDRKLCEGNIWRVFHEKACKHYWTNDYIIKNFCRFIYQTTVDDICIWDFEKDFEILYESIRNEFNHIIDELDMLEFKGTKLNYDEFLNEHQEEILAYKILIQTFFRDKMKVFIKNRVQRNLLRMEAIFT